MLFLSTAESISADPIWARIGRSTVLDLVMNAQTEENEFIEDAQATTDVMSYNPSIAGELQTNKGDAAFDHVYAMFKGRPTGEQVKKRMLLVFAGNKGSESAPEFDGWDCNVTITLDHFDAVAEKVYFSIAINKITDVTVTVENGEPTIKD